MNRMSWVELTLGWAQLSSARVALAGWLSWMKEMDAELSFSQTEHRKYSTCNAP